MISEDVLAVQKVLSGSGRARRLRLMEKYIGHRLVARPELDNTFWTDSTIIDRKNVPPTCNHLDIGALRLPTLARKANHLLDSELR